MYFSNIIQNYKFLYPNIYNNNENKHINMINTEFLHKSVFLKFTKILIIIFCKLLNYFFPNLSSTATILIY